MKTFKEFKDSLQENKIPKGLNRLLVALWLDAKGNWDEAHKIAQSVTTVNGSLVHAYLHREEGDLGNSSYWYSKAGKQLPNISLQEEWEQIVTFLLEN
jgi:hypothetical protein